MKHPIRIYPQLVENIRAWPIHKVYEDREDLVETVDRLTLQHILDKHGERIGDLISRVSYLELIRLKESPWKVDPPNETQFWKKVRAEVTAHEQLGPAERQKANTELLRRIIHRYTTEICGNFKESTFKFARRFLTMFFKRMLNAAASKNIFSQRHELYERLRIHGNVELVRELFNKGTVVILPTHQSNLDSVLIGYALDAVVGLPAFTYGAGLNLFESEIFAYYMSRLGAYKVDRRKKNPVYLDSLKYMSQVMLERGTNSLFFPGGTRSRSGALERELKLGLLNSLIAAQRSIYEGGGQKKIIVVPLVIGYHCVLEAQPLINSYLKTKGEEKYVSTGRRFIPIRNLLSFAWKFFAKSSEIHLSFGEPIDILGYTLDRECRSIDERGHEVNLQEFFSLHGEIQANRQRESVYTRKLADAVVGNYERYYVVLTSHLVAFTAFQLLRKMHPTMDLYALLRLPEDLLRIPMPLFRDVLEAFRAKLKEMAGEGKIHLQEEVMAGTTDDIIQHGLKNLGAFHAVKPLRIGADGQLQTRHIKLVYYYHNRMTGFELEDKIHWDMDRIQQAVRRQPATSGQA